MRPHRRLHRCVPRRIGDPREIELAHEEGNRPPCGLLDCGSEDRCELCTLRRFAESHLWCGVFAMPHCHLGEHRAARLEKGYWVQPHALFWQSGVWQIPNIYTHPGVTAWVVTARAGVRVSV